MFNGKLLKERRFEKGWTQLDLALKMGVSHQYVSNWERGICNPSSGNILKLLKVFKTSNYSVFCGG